MNRRYNIIVLLNISLLLCIYGYLYIIYNKNNCISLIIPSTEEDFYKCMNQFFYHYKSYELASEIVVAISSVKNITKIKSFIYNNPLKKKIVLGLRSTNHNAASNRNYGYTLSRCNIISFTDIDDIMSVNRLKIMYNLFQNDKNIEFVIHKYSKECNTIYNRMNLNTNINLYLYNISYQYIYNSYKRYSKYDKPNMRFCCKYIPEIKHARIHNGWPTLRRYVMSKIKYNENYSLGQDSDFNARVILRGYRAAIVNISLGFYIKDNKCSNYTDCM